MACTQAQRPADMDRIVREAKSSVTTEPDPEALYHVGALLANCGQENAALRLLKAAVVQNYCAHTALQTDPMLVKLHGTPEFSRLLSTAEQCQKQVPSAGRPEPQ
jgi:hypothetical protein